MSEWGALHSLQDVVRLIKILICTLSASDKYLSGCGLIIRIPLINLHSLFSISSYTCLRPTLDKHWEFLMHPHPSDLLSCLCLMFYYFKRKQATSTIKLAQNSCKFLSLFFYVFHSAVCCLHRSSTASNKHDGTLINCAVLYFSLFLKQIIFPSGP